jgi:hypothetical protein
MAIEQPNSYQSYLLRLWRSSQHGAWHGSLQNTANGEKHSFGDLPALWTFLAGQLEKGDQTNDQHAGRRSSSQMQASADQPDQDYTTT